MGQEVDQLHKPFMTWLRREGIPFIRARSDKRSTLDLGVHDFTVLLPRNVSVCIEFKDKGGNLSKYQREWIDDCAKAGVTVYVLRQLKEAVDLIQQFRSNIEPTNNPVSRMVYRSPASSSLRLLESKGISAVVRPTDNGYEIVRAPSDNDKATLQRV